MNIKENFSLKSLNTFGIDAKAKYFIEFDTIQNLLEIISESKWANTEKLILGGGSNILLTKDFNGLVLQNRIKGIEILKEEGDDVYIKSGAGETWHELVMYCLERNLGGIENLSLIPGTVGAAPMQNIGAYGVEIKDVFYSLDAINQKDGKLRTFTKEDCEFGYRESIFKRSLKGEFVICFVVLKLSKKPVVNISYGAIKQTLDEMGVKELTIQAISKAICYIRTSKLPDPKQIGNAGSFFKNPEIAEKKFKELLHQYPDMPSYKTIPGMMKVPAGWLNEQCGWKGKVVGKTGVHKNQALVLVNYGGATGQEIKNLSEDIKKSVWEKFGIEMETEVNII